MRVLLMTISSLFLLLSAGQAAIFPQLVLGGGYEAVLLISNKRPYGWNGTFSLKWANGKAWPNKWSVSGDQVTASISEFVVKLGPNASSKIVLTGEGDAQPGYLEYSGSTDVVVSYFYVLRGSDGQIADSIGSSAATPRQGFEFPVERTPSTDTGFAWVADIDSTPFSITLTLFDSGGTQTQTKVMTYDGHKAVFFSQVFDSIPSAFTGRLRIESKRFICLEVLRMDVTKGGIQFTHALADWFIP